MEHTKETIMQVILDHYKITRPNEKRGFPYDLTPTKLTYYFMRNLMGLNGSEIARLNEQSNNSTVYASIASVERAMTQFPEALDVVDKINRKLSSVNFVQLPRVKALKLPKVASVNASAYIEPKFIPDSRFAKYFTKPLN